MELKLQFLLLIGCVFALAYVESALVPADSDSKEEESMIDPVIAEPESASATEDIEYASDEDDSGVLTEEQLAEMVAAEEASGLLPAAEKSELDTSTEDPNYTLPPPKPNTYECKSHNVRERVHFETNGAHEVFGYRLIANYANGTVNAEEDFYKLECKDYEAFLDKIDKYLDEGAVSVTIDRQGVEFVLSVALLKTLAG